MKTAYVQNGRAVTWEEVTTEDLRATIVNYPASESATYAREEWERRMGKPFFEATPVWSSNPALIDCNASNRLTKALG